MADIKVGCIVLAPIYPDVFHAIDCKSNRGIILPGGKWEKGNDKTYRHAAAREFKEEIGLVTEPEHLEYIFQAPDGGEYITMAFYCHAYSGFPIETDEGVPSSATFEDLKRSHFGAWYDLLHNYMESRNWQPRGRRRIRY